MRVVLLSEDERRDDASDATTADEERGPDGALREPNDVVGLVFSGGRDVGCGASKVSRVLRRVNPSQTQEKTHPGIQRVR